MKKKAFSLNSENTKQAIGITVTFILENKLQKYIFKQKVTIFPAADAFILHPY